MRKNLGPKSMLYPEPVLVVASYDNKGVANAMVAAWGGLSCDNEVCICLAGDHKSTKNILKRKAFSISPATKKYVKQCDYLGCISGNDEVNKLEKVKFHTFKSKKVDAPIIEELPFTLECRLIKYEKNTCHMFGEIVNISVDDSVLTNGKVDIKKLEPVVYDEHNHTYNLIGKQVGKAYSDYKKIK